jgi:uncharacterized protein YndB with AHSA1/START domain
MGTSVESEVTIARPVEEVFAYVLDLEANGSTWAPDLASVEKTSEGPVGAGTTFKQVQTVMGRRRETSLRFTAVEPNQKIEAAAELGPIAPTMTLTFEQVGDQTRVAARGDANPKGLFKLLSPLIGRQGRRMWEARLSGLKNALES